MSLLSNTFLALEKKLAREVQVLFQNKIAHLVQPQTLKLQTAPLPSFANTGRLFFREQPLPEIPTFETNLSNQKNNNPWWIRPLIYIGLAITAFIVTKPIWGPAIPRFKELWGKDPETGTPVLEPKPASDGDDCIPKVLSILNEKAQNDGEISRKLKGKSITIGNLCEGFISDLFWDLKDDPRISENCYESFKDFWLEKCKRDFPHNGEMDAYK